MSDSSYMKPRRRWSHLVSPVGVHEVKRQGIDERTSMTTVFLRGIGDG
jgi:hypothetical protein